MLRIVLFVVLGVLFAAALFLWWSYGRFDSEIRSDIERLRENASGGGAIIDEARLAPLPEPAQRYFRRAGIVGTAIPNTVRVVQVGRIRSSENANWMELDGEEHYSVSPPAFIWSAFLPSRSLPIVIGRDEYMDGESSILMKMAAVIPVAEASSEDLLAAGLLRYLNEVMWFPAAYFGNNVTISAESENAFNVEIVDGGVTAKATIFVDDEGRLINFRANRFNTDTRQLEVWETPITEHHVYSGLELPRRGTAVWKLPSGDFTYIELTVTDIAYDLE